MSTSLLSGTRRWHPTQLSGLQMFPDLQHGACTDASLLTPASIDGASIGSVRDLSGNANHMLQANASARATRQWLSNGDRSFWSLLKVPASVYNVPKAVLNGLTKCTALCIYATNPSTTDASILGSYMYGTLGERPFYFSPAYAIFGEDGSGFRDALQAAPIPSTVVWRAHMMEAEAGELIRYYQEGVEISYAAGRDEALALPADVPHQPAVFGYRVDTPSNSTFRCALPPVVFNRILTAAEKTLLARWVQRKYGCWLYGMSPLYRVIVDDDLDITVPELYTGDTTYACDAADFTQTSAGVFRYTPTKADAGQIRPIKFTAADSSGNHTEMNVSVAVFYDFDLFVRPTTPQCPANTVPQYNSFATSAPFVLDSMSVKDGIAYALCQESTDMNFPNLTTYSSPIATGLTVWTRQAGAPTLIGDGTTARAKYLVHPTRIIRVGDRYLRYIQTHDPTGTQFTIHCITSDDLITWDWLTPTSQVITGTTHRTPDLLRGLVFGKLAMILNAAADNTNHLYLSDPDDGVTWTYFGPLRTATLGTTFGTGLVGFDGSMAMNPHGLYESMLSVRPALYQELKHAISPDGLTYIEHPNANALVWAGTGTDGDWDAREVGDAGLMWLADGTVLLAYSAGNYAMNQYSGGLATLTP